MCLGLPFSNGLQSLMFQDSSLQHLFIPPWSLAECLSNSIKTHGWLKNKVGGGKDNKNKPAERQRCLVALGFSFMESGNSSKSWLERSEARQSPMYDFYRPGMKLCPFHKWYLC